MPSKEIREDFHLIYGLNIFKKKRARSLGSKSQSFLYLPYKLNNYMDSNKIDKEVLKNALKEILSEDMESFRGLLKETILEILSEIELEKGVESRRQKLESYIDEDFANYDEVFKALA